jgi:hypothetical protein
VLELRRDAARRIGLCPQQKELVLAFRLRRDQCGAPAGQHRVVDPALGAFPVADLAPVLEFGGHFDRKRGAAIDPGDILLARGPGAHIDLVGFQTDEARHWQSADRSGRTCAAAVATAAPVASMTPTSRSTHPRITSLFILTQKFKRRRHSWLPYAVTAALSCAGHLVERDRCSAGRSQVSAGAVNGT